MIFRQLQRFFLTFVYCIWFNKYMKYLGFTSVVSAKMINTTESFASSLFLTNKINRKCLTNYRYERAILAVI